jgi:hypothetical protein
MYIHRYNDVYVLLYRCLCVCGYTDVLYRYTDVLYRYTDVLYRYTDVLYRYNDVSNYQYTYIDVLVSLLRHVFIGIPMFNHRYNDAFVIGIPITTSS